MTKNQKGFSFPLIIVLIVLLAIAASLYYSKNKLSNQQPDQYLSASSEPSLPELALYTDPDYNFSVSYPPDWKIKEISDDEETGEPIYLLRSIKLEEPMPKECLPQGCGGSFPGLIIDILDNSHNKPMTTFLSEIRGSQAQNYKQTAHINIGKELLINREEPGAGPGQQAFISHDNKIISLYCSGCNDSLFNQILQSFK